MKAMSDELMSLMQQMNNATTVVSPQFEPEEALIVEDDEPADQPPPFTEVSA